MRPLLCVLTFLVIAGYSSTASPTTKQTPPTLQADRALATELFKAVSHTSEKMNFAFVDNTLDALDQKGLEQLYAIFKEDLAREERTFILPPSSVTAAWSAYYILYGIDLRLHRLEYHVVFEGRLKGNTSSLFGTAEDLIMPEDRRWLEKPLLDKLGGKLFPNSAGEKLLPVFFSIATQQEPKDGPAAQRWISGQDSYCLYINTRQPDRNEAVLMRPPIQDASGQNRCPDPR